MMLRNAGRNDESVVAVEKPTTEGPLPGALRMAAKMRIGTMPCIGCERPVSTNKGICLACLEKRADAMAEKIVMGGGQPA